MDDRMREPHPNAANAGAPGASGPDDPAYDREPQIGEDAGIVGATEEEPTEPAS